MSERPERIVLHDLLNPGQDFDRFEWEYFREGVRICRLYGNQSEGPSAALLRYEPGASVPYHEHQGFEHIMILSGSQTDESGENPAGTVIVNPPGSLHSVRNVNGCVVLVIWEKPVKFKSPPPLARIG